MLTATVLANPRLATNPVLTTGTKSPERGPSEDGFAPLRKIGTVSSFARNKTIFNEGDAAEFSYKVIAGAVRLCKVLPDGRRQIAFFFMPGDYFGLGQAGEHAYTAEAVSDVTLACYARRRMEGLCDELPGVRKELVSRLHRDLSDAQKHLVMLGRQTAKERVASFLLILVERVRAKDGDTIDLPMGRQDIADYLGLTIETVCRALSDLKRSKVISTPNTHQAVLHDIAALHKTCENEL
jgi:CRP-like cAMP-binding protein